MATKENLKSEVVQKNDFIEIEFTGKIVDTGEIFDTNIKSDAQKANLNQRQELKPFVMCVGHGMIIKGLDKELEGKQINKKYSSEFTPEDAFGKRSPQLIKMIPFKKFAEQNVNPQRGMKLSLDGQIVKILSNSGGRVLVDFNNPLAGKKVKYEYKINKKITNTDDKINALQDFLFRKKFKFKVPQDKKNKKTIIFQIPEKEKQMEKFIQMLSKPFEQMLNMKVETEFEK